MGLYPLMHRSWNVGIMEVWGEKAEKAVLVCSEPNSPLFRTRDPAERWGCQDALHGGFWGWDKKRGVDQHCFGGKQSESFTRLILGDAPFSFLTRPINKSQDPGRRHRLREKQESPGFIRIRRRSALFRGETIWFFSRSVSGGAPFLCYPTGYCQSGNSVPLPWRKGI